MGQRTKKQKKHHPHTNQTHTPPTTTLNTTPQKSNVTSVQKNVTIPANEFFGFSPAVFVTDLKRTGWATLTTLVILGLIYVYQART